jgi:hypothetical protein
MALTSDKTCLPCRTDEHTRDMFWLGSHLGSHEKFLKDEIKFCTTCLHLMQAYLGSKPRSEGEKKWKLTPQMKDYVKAHKLESLTPRQIEATLGSLRFAKWLEDKRQSEVVQSLRGYYRAQLNSLKEKGKKEALISYIKDLLDLDEVSDRKTQARFRDLRREAIGKAEEAKLESEIQAGLARRYMKDLRQYQSELNALLHECQGKNLHDCDKIRRVINQIQSSTAS